MSKSKPAASAAPVESAEPIPFPVPSNLSDAIVAAQLSIDRVAKSSSNSFHNYRYTSADTMIGATRSALAMAGLAVRRESWTISTDERYVESVLSITFGPTGESRVDRIAWPIIAEKGRPADKALAGALTVSLSYWLRDLLLLPRDDDGEMDRRDDRRSDETTTRGLGHRTPPRANGASVSRLNDALATRRPAAGVPAAIAPRPTAEPEAATRHVRGRIVAVERKTVGEDVWQLVDIDGVQYVASRSITDDVSHYRGADVDAIVSDRPGGKSPVLHDFNVRESMTADSANDAKGAADELF